MRERIRNGFFQWSCCSNQMPKARENAETGTDKNQTTRTECFTVIRQGQLRFRCAICHDAYPLKCTDLVWTEREKLKPNRHMEMQLLRKSEEAETSTPSRPLPKTIPSRKPHRVTNVSKRSDSE